MYSNLFKKGNHKSYHAWHFCLCQLEWYTHGLSSCLNQVSGIIEVCHHVQVRTLFFSPGNIFSFTLYTFSNAMSNLKCFRWTFLVSQTRSKIWITYFSRTGVWMCGVEEEKERDPLRILHSQGLECISF